MSIYSICTCACVYLDVTAMNLQYSEVQHRVILTRSGCSRAGSTRSPPRTASATRKAESSREGAGAGEGERGAGGARGLRGILKTGA